MPDPALGRTLGLRAPMQTQLEARAVVVADGEEVLVVAHATVAAVALAAFFLTALARLLVTRALAEGRVRHGVGGAGRWGECVDGTRCDCPCARAFPRLAVTKTSKGQKTSLRPRDDTLIICAD